MDPYKVLGVSPSATDDEVKQAYRTLSKKYHPDANINNVHKDEYTEKFKEVQQAYKTIMDERKKGFTGQSYGNTNQGYNGNQSYNGNQGSYQGYRYANDQEALKDAAAFLNASRYQDAIRVLDSVKNKNAEWFYYSAIAQSGVGNNVTALEYAQTAAQMDPNNLNYRFLVQQLQGSQGQYRQQQRGYGANPYASMYNCCYAIMLLNCISACCCRY